MLYSTFDHNERYERRAVSNETCLDSFLLFYLFLLVYLPGFVCLFIYLFTIVSANSRKVCARLQINGNSVFILALFFLLAKTNIYQF